jgi:hypothetical protein
MEEYCCASQDVGFVMRCLYDVQMTEAMVAKLPEQNRQFPWFPMYHHFPFFLILDLSKATG